MKRCYELLSRMARAGAGMLAIGALFLPVAGRGQDIVINEVVAANQSITPLAQFPEYTPDYVELYNNTDTEISLADGGWTLSNKKNPSAADFKDHFFFPQGTTIPAFGYLLVFMDDDTAIPGIHTTFTRNGTNVTFTLSGSGDEVVLYKDFRSTRVDSIFFGIQAPDLALGRFPSGSTNQIFLVKPSPMQPNEVLPLGDPLKIRINEWQALGTKPGVTGRATNDWIELYNPESNAVSIAGLLLADPSVAPASATPFANLSFIAPFGFVQIFLVDDANDPDELEDFSLSSSSVNGDRIFLYASDRTTLLDEVPTAPVPASRAGETEGRVPDGGDTIITFKTSTPLDSNFGPIPEIVINEVLPHTDVPLEDAIELYNPTAAAVDVSGWWLSNQGRDAKKFQIPAGTVIPAGGYKVFYEFAGLPGGFNPNGTGTDRSFTLNSSDGDELWLFKAKPDGSLLGFRRGIDFPASINGVSFGRHVNSDGSVDIVPVSDLSFGTSVRAQQLPSNLAAFRTGTGAPNPYPLVGPIVINEIHYNPMPDIAGGQTNDNSRVEFVELRNVTDAPAPLYLIDSEHPEYAVNTWRIRGDIEFDFPLQQSIPPNGHALLVNFDPETNATQLAEFQNLFPGIPANVRIYGPYKNKLRNGGGVVELRRPDSPQRPDRGGFTPYALADRISYNDEAPWPLSPDGTGHSLQRNQPTEYGNDPANWKGAAPTPGRPNAPGALAAPTLPTPPASQTVPAGSTATFTASGAGEMLAYRWQFNGATLLNATNPTLRINNVSTDNLGAYRVRVSNPAGDVLSAPAMLTIGTTMTDTTRPTIAFVSPAANAKLTQPVATVTGTAKDNVAVTKVEVELNSGGFTEATGTVNWQATLNLVPGTNVVRIRAMDEAGNTSLTSTRSFIYVVTAPLTITKIGNGTVTGATNGQPLELGRRYTITAVPASGWLFSGWAGHASSTAPLVTFTMDEFAELIVTFVPNPFIPTKGNYNGLFYEATGAQHLSSGFFTLNLTDRGSFTATLQNAGKRYSTRGQFDLAGHAMSTIPRTGTNPLTIDWNVLLDGSDKIDGSVTDGTWTAPLMGDRVVWNSRSNAAPFVGKYTMILPGNTNPAPDSPLGDGFGSATVDAGGFVNFRGTLADGTLANQRVALSTNGTWPLYVSLYGGKGSLIGWVDFDLLDVINPSSERLSWIKPPSATSKYYPTGFNVETPLIGSAYVQPPGTTNRVLNLTGGVISFAGGNLAESVTNTFTLGPGSKFTNGQPARVTLTFTLPTGLFTGSLTPTGSTRALPFKGAVLQNMTNASGFLLGTNESGKVLLEAAP